MAEASEKLVDEVPDASADKYAGEGGLLDNLKADEPAPDDGTDRADIGEGAEEAPKVYDPGKLPDGILGKTDQETIDNLNKAYKNARTALSKGAKTDLPKTAEEYAIAADGDDDKIAAVLNSEDNADLMKGVREAAFEHGMSNAQFNGFLRTVMSKAGELGLDGSGDAFDFEGEVAKLGGREKAGAVIEGVGGWLKGLQSQGILNEEEFEDAKLMAGTALGVRVMAKLRDLTGEKPIPLHSVSGSAKSKVELDSMLADPRYFEDGPKGEAFRREVDAEFEKFYGTGPAIGGVARDPARV